ncbi:uncharacterized protein LOC127288375 [Leptopilina boulardi]|uniref:uncharacterized protein LOC127288375 n=1 Tax=Leptopilina boulardi TaxID=63433 RepID=UPI0021F58B84|nr:uncharacterized protein LOC127288375 [Leptopilina boulardi]
MLKLIIILYSLIVVSHALEFTITVTTGHIIQGTNSSGVMVRKNKGQQEIVWQEKFDNDNSLTVYYMQASEATGLVETIKIDNLCNKYESGSLEHSVKYFILNKFGNTNKCSIKKRKVKISYPLIAEFQGTTENTNCGSTIGTFHIVRNNPTDSDKTPVLISAWFRGSISGDSCE